MTRKYICPECKQKTGVNIVYGYPSAELFEAANRDEVALGGCIIDNEQKWPRLFEQRPEYFKWNLC